MTSKTTAALCQQAYRLGSIDAYVGRRRLDMQDADSAVLMERLGITSATTAGNHAARQQMCDAYDDGYDDAYSAMGGGPDADDYDAESRYADDGWDRSGVSDGRGHTYSDADPGL